MKKKKLNNFHISRFFFCVSNKIIFRIQYLGKKKGAQGTTAAKPTFLRTSVVKVDISSNFQMDMG